jgi:hypothetical protein
MTETRQIYTLEDLYEQRFAPLSSLNLDRVSATIEAYASNLSARVNEMLDVFSEETVKPRAIWGGAPVLNYIEVGEFGKGKTRKEIFGQELHFPLAKISATVGKSDEFWRKASVKDLRDVMLGMENGYFSRVRDEIKAAIFNNTVRIPQKDWLGDNSTLNKVQPFLNADGNEIPMAPNGSTFTAASHQHYLGITGSTIAVSDVNYLLGHVREHLVGEVRLYVDGAMPATLAALSSTPFVYNQYTNIIDQTAGKIGSTANRDGGQTDRNNMFIGTWDGHEVHTRSWVPTGYLCAVGLGDAMGKPLWRRVDPTAPGLITGVEIKDGRITVSESHFYMGFGAFNRSAGAVLDAATGNGTYTVPTGLVRS